MPARVDLVAGGDSAQIECECESGGRGCGHGLISQRPIGLRVASSVTLANLEAVTVAVSALRGC